MGAPKLFKLKIALSLFFTLLAYLHIQGYLSYFFSMTWDFIASGGYKAVVNLQNVYLRLFVMFCFWFTMAILGCAIFWLFRVLYTDFYNFLIVKVLYKNEEGSIEDLVGREIKLIKRIGIHSLGIIPFILMLVLIYSSFLVFEGIWTFFVKSSGFNMSFNPLGYQIKYPVTIFYLVILFYWYLIFSLLILTLGKIREIFAAEEMSEEHNL